MSTIIESKLEAIRKPQHLWLSCFQRRINYWFSYLIPNAHFDISIFPFQLSNFSLNVHSWVFLRVCVYFEQRRASRVCLALIYRPLSVAHMSMRSVVSVSKSNAHPDMTTPLPPILQWCACLDGVHLAMSCRTIIASLENVLGMSVKPWSSPTRTIIQTCFSRILVNPRKMAKCLFVWSLLSFWCHGEGAINTNQSGW